MKKLLSFSLITTMLLALIASPVFAKKGDRSEGGEPKKKGVAFAKKGRITVFGSLSFDSTTTTPFNKDGKALDDSATSATTFTLAPRVGYFVIKGLEVAVDFTYISTTNKEDGKEKGSTIQTIPGIDLAYYLTQTKGLKKMGLFPYAHFGLGYAMSSDKAGSTTTDSSGVKLTPGIGMAWAFGKAKGGVVKLGIDYQMLTQADDKEKNGFDFSSFRFATSFGLYF
jgi:hypothetical protein